jgi:hypothetical protein
VESEPIAIKAEWRRVTQFVSLEPAIYVPQQFDLMDLNSLSEFVHRAIEQELRAILKEKALDQEIDFEIIRGDRDRALDRSRHGEAPAPAASGLWSRIFGSAAAWQSAGLTEERKSVAEPVQPGRAQTAVATGADVGGAISLAALATAVYVIGLWTTASTQVWPGLYYFAIPQIMQAGLVGVALWWLGGAVFSRALMGAAALFVLTSAIAIAESAISRQFSTGLMLTLSSVLASALMGAAIMIVTGAAVPAVRKLSYWLIALLGLAGRRKRAICRRALHFALLSPAGRVDVHLFRSHHGRTSRRSCLLGLLAGRSGRSTAPLTPSSPVASSGRTYADIVRRDLQTCS